VAVAVVVAEGLGVGVFTFLGRPRDLMIGSGSSIEESSIDVSGVTFSMSSGSSAVTETVLKSPSLIGSESVWIGLDFFCFVWSSEFTMLVLVTGFEYCVVLKVFESS
jgi:hypothetical protein